LKQNFNDLN